MKRIFQRCPSCNSPKIALRILADQRVQEWCSICSFSADYVLFTCKHCNPEAFALCPRRNCKNPGKPTNKLCSPTNTIIDKIRALPIGYHALNPMLVVKDVLSALSFYKTVFEAEEQYRFSDPSERHTEAILKIGDSMLFLVQEMPEMGSKAPQTLGGSPASIYLYVEDVDRVFERAIKAGATVVMPVMDMLWGDRYGRVLDPFGHTWGIATHKEDVSWEEITNRMKESSGDIGKSKTT